MVVAAEVAVVLDTEVEVTLIVAAVVVIDKKIKLLYYIPTPLLRL